jgi:hypothetical protein
VRRLKPVKLFFDFYTGELFLAHSQTFLKDLIDESHESFQVVSVFDFGDFLISLLLLESFNISNG